jgi:hypothetical protein
VERQLGRAARLCGQSGSRERLGEQLLRYQLPRPPWTAIRASSQRHGQAHSGLHRGLGGARYILADEITAWLDEGWPASCSASCVNWPIRAAASLGDPRSGAGGPLCRSHRGAASGAGERYPELPSAAGGRGARCSAPTGRRCRSSIRSSLHRRFPDVGSTKSHHRPEGTSPLAGVIADGESGRAARHLRPSGHGKTTLGRVLAGWQPVGASGQILLDGQPVPEQVKAITPSSWCPSTGTHLQSLSHHRAGAVGCMAPR